MKYNRKEIMKKAWEIKKENENNIFGLCLKMAWEIAKENAKTAILPDLQGSEKQIAWANKIRDNIIINFKNQIKDFEENYENSSNYYDFSVVKNLRRLGEGSYVRAMDQVGKELIANGTPHVIRENGKIIKEDYTLFNKKMKICSIKIFEDILRNEVKAGWWIDRR